MSRRRSRAPWAAGQSAAHNRRVSYRIAANFGQENNAMLGLGNIDALPTMNANKIGIMAHVSTHEDKHGDAGLLDSIPIIRRTTLAQRISEVKVAPAKYKSPPPILEGEDNSFAVGGKDSAAFSSEGFDKSDKPKLFFDKAKRFGAAGRMASSLGVSLEKKEPVHKFKIVHEASEEHYKYIIDCDSKFRRYWDILVVIFVLYLCFTVPLSIALIDIEFNSALSTISDLVFYTDMVLNFRTSFIHHGENVRNPKEIAKHYVESGWLAVDVLASIPFETLLSGLVDKSARKSIKILKWLKIPKLLRVGRLLRYLKGYVKYYRLFILISVTLLSMHMVGCMFLNVTGTCMDITCSNEDMWRYYYLSLRVSYLMLFQVTDPFTFVGHIDRELYANQSVFESYTQVTVAADEASTAGQPSYTNATSSLSAAFFRHVFDSSTGLPRFYSNDAWSRWTLFDGERGVNAAGIQALSWVGMSIGFWLTVNFIAEAVNFTSNRMHSYNRFYNNLKDLQREMMRVGIPMETQYRVKRYYDYLWINSMFGLNEKGGGILGDKHLSRALQKELALQIHGPLLATMSIFRHASDDCLFAVAMRLKILVFLPGDTVFEKEDVAHELYIIKKGIIAVNFGEVDAFHTSKSDGAALQHNNSQASHLAAAAKTEDETEFQSAKFEDSATLNLMGPGCFFGEIALLTTMPRSCSVYSKTVAELHELSKPDFDEVMIEYPELLQEFRDNVLRLYPGLRAQIERGRHGFDDHKSMTLHHRQQGSAVTKKEVQAMIDKAVADIKAALA